MSWEKEFNDILAISFGSEHYHYDFVKCILKLLESNNFNIDQVIMLGEIVNSYKDMQDHTVYVTLSYNNKTMEIAFPYDNLGPQKLSVDITRINDLTLLDFMKISFTKYVVNDINKIYNDILIETFKFYIENYGL